MQFLSGKIKSSDQTPVSIPLIFRWSERKESLSELGPFIIMEYITHKGSVGDLLEKPGRQGGERPILNPSIEPMKLENLYGQLANIVLSLSTISFSRIGSLDKIDDSTWTVMNRPLSYSMNEVVQLGTLPQSKLPATTYDKASSYLEALAELHISHLTSQRNEANTMSQDTPKDALADGIRRRFVARYLFRKIARDEEQRKEWIFNDNGPFPIWCDDFRPENVLVDENEKIVGVVDWEFTYAAPVEFTYAPPWWLLLQKPEEWSAGLDDWCTEYEKCLNVFLNALWKAESKAIQSGPQLGKGLRLSSRMRSSWQSGDFWIMYAARNNFAFDAVYWERIDRRFFGNAGSAADDNSDVWRERIHLLEPEEIAFMEECVDLKLKSREIDPILAWDPNEYTLGWIKRMKVLRKIKQMKESMEVAVVEWEKEIESMMNVEGKGEMTSVEVVDRIKEINREMETMEIEWQERIKGMKEMEDKEEILDMQRMKKRKTTEWEAEIKKLRDMDG